MHMSKACIPPNEIKKISKKCEGKTSCRLRRKDEPCHSSSKLAIHIKYSCDGDHGGRQDDERDSNDKQEGCHGDNCDQDHGSGEDDDDGRRGRGKGGDGGH